MTGVCHHQELKFNQEFTESNFVNRIEAQVVIVGSGFVGSIVAEKLAAKGVEVAILEAGPRVNRRKAVETFRKALIKVPESPYVTSEEVEFPLAHNPAIWYRQAGPDPFKSTYLKVVGGTSWHWLGTTVRFVPNDFRMKSEYGQAVDWPIGYDELESFYIQAERELAVAGDSSQDQGSPRSGDFPMNAIPLSYLDKSYIRALEGTPYQVESTPQARNSIVYDNRPACCGSASCIPICPVGAKYDATVHLSRAERNGAAVYEETTATFIEADSNQRISGILFRRPDGSKGIATGKLYILAANAIETPRLLLNSRSSEFTNGIANTSDQVGRNLMDHPVQLSWALAEQPVWPYRGPISTAGIENLRDGPQRSTMSSIRTQVSADGWSWPTGGIQTLAQNLARQGFRGKELREKASDHASKELQLASMGEQLPDPQNRITLDSRDFDSHGVALPRIHYKVGRYTLDALSKARTMHIEIFKKMNATLVQHMDEFQGAGHLMGTCRMGTDAKSSVVDSYGRSHDHRNLFIMGAGPFSTSSTANPTLTIVALTLRMVPEILASIE